jgi:hypothetical protein
MLLFEASSMGWKFMVTRFVVDLFGIAAIAFITEKALNKKDIQVIYENAGKETGK